MLNGLKTSIAGLLCLLPLFTISAQQIIPRGKFLQRQAKIGEEIPYVLTAKYPKNLDILFPDSTYDFSPFEFIHRTYFETRTDSVNSIDSVVYYLSTFEIDSVQHLGLPVYIVENGDSTAIFSQKDSIRLEQLIKEMPQKPALKTNTTFVKVRKAFNYPILLTVVGVIVFVLVLVLILFGKKLQKTWRVYRMRRAHRKFTANYFNLIRDVSSNNPSKSIEFVLNVWKSYMEKLEKEPFTKMTTKEIVKVHQNDQLKETLTQIDGGIYGNVKMADLFNKFDYLMKFAVERYHIKVEEVQHG